MKYWTTPIVCSLRTTSPAVRPPYNCYWRSFSAIRRSLCIVFQTRKSCTPKDIRVKLCNHSQEDLLSRSQKNVLYGCWKSDHLSVKFIKPTATMLRKKIAIYLNILLFCRLSTDRTNVFIVVDC